MDEMWVSVEMLQLLLGEDKEEIASGVEAVMKKLAWRTKSGRLGEPFLF